MAQPWVTGPGHIYVGTTGSPLYIGVCKTTPRINFTPRFDQVHSDVAGSMLPHDYLYEGKEANLLCSPLTVWNWANLLSVMTRPSAALPGGGGLPANFGNDIAGSRGTLMNTEDRSYILWVQFPYFTKAAFAPFMPGGFRFPYSFLYGPDDFDCGTKPNEIFISFKMSSKLQANGDWLLCDGNMTGIPLTPPTTLS